MNQIFEDHLPYMIGSAVVALVLFFAPRQTKWAKRLAVSILVLACLYPCGIVWLYAARNNMGESYGYLIGGILLGILMGLIAGALFLSWIIVYLVGIKKRKQTSVGIGSPIAEAPSHITGLTDRVSGDSAVSTSGYPRSDKPSVCVK